MEWLTAILAGLEAPFPIGFVIALSIALYIFANKVKTASENPCKPTPISAKYKITKNIVIIGIVACVIWMAASYFTAFGFIFVPCAIQYLLVGIVSGVTSAGLSTIIYQIIKNKFKLEEIKTINNSTATTEVEKAAALKVLGVEEKTNDTCTIDNDTGDK